MTRVSKEYADYGTGAPGHHCGICRHFEAPDACKIVVGKIRPQDGCRYFEKKPKETEK